MDVPKLYDIKCGCSKFFGKYHFQFLVKADENDENCTSYQSYFPVYERVTEINETVKWRLANFHADHSHKNSPFEIQFTTNHYRFGLDDGHAVRRNDEFINILDKHLLNILASGFFLFKLFNKTGMGFMRWVSMTKFYFMFEEA